MDNISVVLIVILIVFIIILIVRISQRRRHRRDIVETSNQIKRNVNSAGDVHVSGENTNYKVMRGKPEFLDDDHNKTKVAFPRHSAMASKPKKKVENAHVPKNRGKFSNAKKPSEKGSGKYRELRVSSIADAFSPKINYIDEYGVSEKELEKMVKNYEQKKAYKERKLPINRHFNLNSYQGAEKTIRQSHIRSNTSGGKKGIITANIYKKYGKNFIKKKIRQNKANVNSTITTDEQVLQARANIPKRTTNGATLVSRV